MKMLNEYLSMNYRMEVIEDKEEGISMNQYCVYLLSRNDALYSVK